MSTEPVDAGAATELAPETQEPEVVTPEVDANAEQEGAKAEEPEDADKALKRMQRRIDKRTADVYRERARVEQLTAELERVSQAGGEQKPQEQDVDALADFKSRVREFSKEAGRIVQEGSKQHSDYTRVVTEDLVSEVGPLVMPNGLPSPFMAVVLEASDDPKALLYHLGKNPELAEELADLSPIKLAKKLDRIERDLADKSKLKPGSAPKPIEPVRATSSDPGLHAGLSTEEWMKRREAELREKRGR